MYCRQETYFYGLASIVFEAEDGQLLPLTYFLKPSAILLQTNNFLKNMRKT
jgi:hypothetical protein